MKRTEHRAEIRGQCVDRTQDNSEQRDQGPLWEELPSPHQDEELTHKAACEWKRHRRHAKYHEEECGKRNRASQAAETIKVPRALTIDNSANGEEERGRDESVTHSLKNRSGHSHRGYTRDTEDAETEMREP